MCSRYSPNPCLPSRTSLFKSKSDRRLGHSPSLDTPLTPQPAASPSPSGRLFRKRSSRRLSCPGEREDVPEPVKVLAKEESIKSSTSLDKKGLVEGSPSAEKKKAERLAKSSTSAYVDLASLQLSNAFCLIFSFMCFSMRRVYIFHTIIYHIIFNINI